MEITNIPLSKLKPYKQNAKLHPTEQVEYIANSIREFGFRQPLVITADNEVIAGHGRLLAAKKLKLDEVPCVLADDLTDEQIRAYRLADNKTNESDWDFDILNLELDGILDIDMTDFGFTFDEEQPEVIEDDFDGEMPTEPKAKRGDLYQLGCWVYCKKCGKRHNIT